MKHSPEVAKALLQRYAEKFGPVPDILYDLAVVLGIDERLHRDVSAALESGRPVSSWDFASYDSHTLTATERASLLWNLRNEVISDRSRLAASGSSPASLQPSVP